MHNTPVSLNRKPCRKADDGVIEESVTFPDFTSRKQLNDGTLDLLVKPLFSF